MAEEPQAAEHEQVNGRRVRRERRRSPLRHELLEVAAHEDLLVVGGQVKGVWRGEDACPRREQERESASARPALLDDRHEAGERHEHRSEHDRAVQIRPQHEQRQGREDAARRAPGVREHEPERGGEEREGERLRPHD